MEENNALLPPTAPFVATTPVPEPTQPPIQPPPVPEQPGHKIPKWLIILSLAVLFVVIILVTYKLILKNKVTTPPEPTPTASVQPTPDPTADWETYSGKEFSFKYPNGWFSGTSGDGTILINNNPINGGQVVEPDQVIITLEIVANQNLIQAYTKDKNATEKIINGIVFNLIDLSPESLEGAPPKQVFFAQALKNNKLFRFGLSRIEFKEIFDQILSTFKFLDQRENQLKDLDRCVPKTELGAIKCYDQKTQEECLKLTSDCRWSIALP